MKDDPRNWEPAKFFKMVEVAEPVQYNKDAWYIGCRYGQVEHVRCVRAGLSTDKDAPPVFLPSNSTFAFELKVFDWLTTQP